MKKLFIISSVLLGIILFFLGVYNFAFKKESPNSKYPVVAGAPESENMELEKKKEEKIVAIRDQKIVGAVLDKKNEEIKYYDAQNGTAWSINEEGKNEKQLSQTKVPGIKNVSWSADKSKVLTTIEKSGMTFFYEYDYLTNKGVQLKEGLDTAIWDNTGAKIFYKYYNSSDRKRSLNIANPDGSEWQKIADIEFRNVSISPVPFSSLVSFWNSPSSNEESKLQITGITGGEVKTILSGKFGADYLWSPDGSKVLVSSVQGNNSAKTSLGIATIEGSYVDLNIPTFISKCVWSIDNKTLYYALPGGIPDGSIMPNAYQENKFNTEDTFWKVDIATGEKKRVVDTAGIAEKYDSSNLFLSSTEDALFFINRIDQKLYKLKF
ncbi:MAG: hypothetical protein ACD_8C00029G0019 [uncultured bacterium]|nr:MAG: hypothetical protein ACD_8C00029G0019 [uncultured bacterium]